MFNNLRFKNGFVCLFVKQTNNQRKTIEIKNQFQLDDNPTEITFNKANKKTEPKHG